VGPTDRKYFEVTSKTAKSIQTSIFLNFMVVGRVDVKHDHMMLNTTNMTTLGLVMMMHGGRGPGGGLTTGWRATIATGGGRSPRTP
jgi:hypothetical protein